MNTAFRWLLVLFCGAPILALIALSGVEARVDSFDPGAAVCLALGGALLGGVAYCYTTGPASGWRHSED